MSLWPRIAGSEPGDSALAVHGRGDGTGREAPGRAVIIHGDVVIKTGEPERMRVEVEKTRRAHEIGRACGLFRVPRVLEYEPSSGRTVFERLHGIRSVGKRVRCPRLLGTIGRSLAAIHRQLWLPPDMAWPLPAQFRLPGRSEAFLHADFGVGNVCVSRDGSQVVILDWQMTPRFGGRATFGSRYFDLMWFVLNLFSRPLHRYVFSAPAAPSAQVFLRSYFEASEYPYDREELVSYMWQFYGAGPPHPGRRFPWARPLLYVLANARLRAFIRSFHL